MSYPGVRRRKPVWSSKPTRLSRNCQKTSHQKGVSRMSIPKSWSRIAGSIIATARSSLSLPGEGLWDSWLGTGFCRGAAWGWLAPEGVPRHRMDFLSAPSFSLAKVGVAFSFCWELGQGRVRNSWDGAGKERKGEAEGCSRGTRLRDPKSSSSLSCH